MHLRGLEMRPKVQAGCNIGKASQIASNIPNIHLRPFGNEAFQFKQAGTTYLESVHVDLMW